MREAAGGKSRVLLVTTGVATTRALDAAEALEAEGIECTILHAHTVKPLDTVALLEHARGCDLVVTVEEHTVIGGLGSAVLDALVDALPGAMPPVKRLGIPDDFAHKYGNQDQLMELYGLQPQGIADSVRDGLRRRAA
jgi:transketolase